MKFDWLIVGAGYSGAVLAERLATQLGKRVLVVDKRDHIAGNAYDHYDENGVLVHKYGPHIFHANDVRIWDYLSQFTKWSPYYHRVLGMVDGMLVPVPFNLNSLHALFPPSEATKLEIALIEEYGFGVKVPILKLRESTNRGLRILSDYIYKNVFEGYTLKQWGVRPEDLDAGVTGRVPVFISRDNRYFQDSFQAMPSRGYTEMFRKMLSNRNIKVMLNTDYREVVEEIQFSRMIYTGPVDSFFDNMHGQLGYRSLRFDFSYSGDECFTQQVGTVNYPNEQPFTRITEFKHLTGQRHHGSTVVTEYPQAYIQDGNDPYYPFPTPENREIALKYAHEVEKLKGSVLFVGRLAEYKYYNMDQATGRALKVFENIVSNDL